MNLYNKYRGRVNFVIVDLDAKPSAAQRQMLTKYYQGYVPHIVILDKRGKTIYDEAGERDEQLLANILDEALK